MKQADLGEKDYLTQTEAVQYWNLSYRKFVVFLKKGEYDFLAFYGKRKLILRVSFERYLWAHPEVKEMLKSGKEG